MTNLCGSFGVSEASPVVVEALSCSAEEVPVTPAGVSP